ncbi:MAG: hypothetical protein ACLQUY_10320 [Ktedonobacterales bacterium]
MGGFGSGDDLGRGIEGTGIYIPRLQADDGGTREIRKLISTDAALFIHWDADYPVTTKPGQSQGLEQRDMGFLANDHSNFRSAEQAIGFHIPSGLRKYRVARPGQNT